MSERGKPKPNAAVTEFAATFARQADVEHPPSLGFSARLNMLIDLAGILPAQNAGRVTAMLTLNREWHDSEVRKWLQQDLPPPPLELHNLVKFLVSHLEGRQDPRHWEAFLVYGSPIVTSPVNHLIYREDQNRRNIASMIFATLTERYHISPSSYDAEEVFQRCLIFMQRMNIYELRDFQPGHIEPFRNFLFPQE